MQPNSKQTRIFLAGNVCAGKSSFLNALAGNLVSPTSKQQTNTGFQRYWFSVNGSDDNAEGMTDIKPTDNNKNTEQTSLPTRYGLQDYVVYDFPGISDDPTPTLNDISNNIKDCDLLVYAVDYNALLNTNVYNNFNKLHAMVEQKTSSGKFAECVIVVNKCDDCEEDESYMTTLCNNTSLPRTKIFRCSSHKMLMNSLKLHKTNIQIPVNMRDEWNYILRNTDVTDDVKKSLRTHILNGSDVVYSEYATDRDHVSRGDWDTFTEFVRKLQGSILTKRRRLLEITFNKVFENAGDKNTCMSVCDEVLTHVSTIQNYGIELEQFILPILEKNLHSLCKKPEGQNILYSLYRHYSSELTGFYDLLLKNKSHFSETFLACLFYHHRSDEKVWDLYQDVLSNPNLWKDFSMQFYDIQNKRTCTHFAKLPGNHHESPFINNLLSESHAVLQFLLKLSLVPNKELRCLDSENVMPYDLLRNIGTDKLVRQVRYYLQNKDDGFTCAHLLFGVDPDPSINNYLNKCEEFKQLTDLHKDFTLKKFEPTQTPAEEQNTNVSTTPVVTTTPTNTIIFEGRSTTPTTQTALNVEPVQEPLNEQASHGPSASKSKKQSPKKNQKFGIVEPSY
jgi:GTPase Era involved in 16S rRNA processing